MQFFCSPLPNTLHTVAIKMKYSLHKSVRLCVKTLSALMISIVLVSVSFAQSDSPTEATDPIDPKSTRTVTQIVDDSAVTFRIKNFISRNTEISNQSNVNVTTVSGVVLLTGNVESAEQKTWIEQLAQSEQGVRKVINELRVEKIRNAFVMGRDKILQLSVKHRLTSRLKDWSAKVQVIVYRKTVYLMGVIPSDIADTATEIARTTKGAERIVKVFELEEE